MCFFIHTHIYMCSVGIDLFSQAASDRIKTQAVPGEIQAGFNGNFFYEMVVHHWNGLSMQWNHHHWKPDIAHLKVWHCWVYLGVTNG